MSTFATKGNWNIAKGKLKQKIARLTNEELQFFDAGDDLLGRIQKRASQFRGKIRHLRHEADESQMPSLNERGG